MTPLTNAMGLVHRDARHAPALEFINHATGKEPLRGEVQQLELAGVQSTPTLPALRLGQGGIEKGRRHAICPERIHLILHERDQRRDHDG